MATRWCLICEAEYLATVDECPDCEVPLVDEKPQHEGLVVGDGQVAYDLAEWASESRVMLERLLDSEGVRHAWEGTTLVADEAFEIRIDNLVEHVEVTTLPTLDPDAEKLAYDVSDWSDDMVATLQSMLSQAGVPFEFNADGDVVTLAEHDARVEALLDAIEFPDGRATAETDGETDLDEDVDSDADADVPDGDGRTTSAPSGSEDLGERFGGPDDDDGYDDELEYDDELDEDIDASAVLSDLFISTDRMMKNPRDHAGVLTFVDAADLVEQMGLPYGFAEVVWEDIFNQVTNIRELIEDDDSSDKEIKKQARDLRNTLRSYV